MLPRAAINVTPMIDVMLVVLMIFMVIVPAITTPVNLPLAANADPRPVEDDEIILRIDRKGTYTLENPSRLVTPDELRSELGRLYSGRTRDRVLYLKADADLAFGAVEHAIEIARESGVRVVGAVTERGRVR